MEIQDLNSPYGGGDQYAGGDSHNPSGHYAEANPAFAPAIEADPFNGYENYYSFDEREQWLFPDKKQWIQFKKLTEGDRARYLKATRSDVHLNQKSGEARIPFDQSADRRELLLASITDWHIVSFATGRPVPIPFQPPVNTSGKTILGGTVSQWIQNANPEILGSLEKAIRKYNPWLLNEMSVEQIDKEIADLTELRTAAEKREAEEANFTSK
jgi:hypothetical protein